jgi:sugar phosphate permease
MEYIVRCAINSWSVVYIHSIAFDFGVVYAQYVMSER